MKLVVISHKPCWANPDSPTGYATDGGFPMQMTRLSELFDSTTLVVLNSRSPKPTGTTNLAGFNLQVFALDAPMGRDLVRKLLLPLWLLRNLSVIWQQVQQADAVHTPIPGDIGVIGIFIALLQKKKLFVRHCGTWGSKRTIADRFITWLLPRITNQRRIVMATGGGDKLPEQTNPDINWIFSTSLCAQEFNEIPIHQNWKLGSHIRLISVGRVVLEKNFQSIIKALPIILDIYPDTSLHLLGDGSYRATLLALVNELGLSNRVIFHGNVSHKAVLEELSQAHLFVFPTRVEGFPKAIIEAMACGLPVIASRVSVLPHLIGDSCGVILDSPDHKVIADAVVTLLADETHLEEMSQNAQSTAKYYTLENWSKLIDKRLSANWGQLRKY